MSGLLFLFPGAGRRSRLAQVASGEVPKDFYYGFLAVQERGWDVLIGDTRAAPRGRAADLRLRYERIRNRVSNFGLTRQRVLAVAEALRAADLAISFTDAFSVSLGMHGSAIVGEARPLMIGGFHGLCDMVDEVRPAFRSFARRAIHNGVRGLDLVFFFGPADREEAIQRYGLEPERTFLFPFGVDTDFWRPDPSGAADEGFVFAAGSDIKRDYPCLLEAPFNAPTRILTRLRLPASPDKTDLEIIRGSYHNAAVTDAVLRDLYLSAAAVVVPVRDVFQPSGYSVTLQAMACGKAVVLSRIKGLWDPEVFKSEVNCILVAPGNRSEMARAIQRLIDDPQLRAGIGAAARETALTSFDLERMNRGLEEMIHYANRLGPRGAA